MDLSKIERRIAAHLAGKDQFLKAFSDMTLYGYGELEMPGYGCLCGGCNNCLEAQGYDLDRLAALDAGMDDEVLDEWLADAEKISEYTSYFDETNWKPIEQRVALGDGDALLAEFRAQLRDVMTDDAKDEATARYKAERLDREMP